MGDGDVMAEFIGGRGRTLVWFWLYCNIFIYSVHIISFHSQQEEKTKKWKSNENVERTFTLMIFDLEHFKNQTWIFFIFHSYTYSPSPHINLTSFIYAEKRELMRRDHQLAGRRVLFLSISIYNYPIQCELWKCKLKKSQLCVTECTAGGGER